MADGTDRRIALLAIHPRFAQGILDGTKTVELRRRPPSHVLTHIVIYATAPIARIVGWAEVERMDIAAPSRLWLRWRTQSGVTRREFRSYFSGLPTGAALVLSKSTRLDRQFQLGEVGIQHPPQNFIYLSALAAEVIGLPKALDRVTAERRQSQLVGIA